MPSYQRKAIDVPVRPLISGMVVDTPPNLLGKGAFSYLDNYFVTSKGIKKRPSIEYSNYDSLIALDPPINRIITLGSQDGTEQTLVADGSYLYKVTGSTLTPIYDTYTTGTISTCVNGALYATLTGVATAWNSTGGFDLMPGDDLIVNDAAGTTEIFRTTLRSVTNQTTLTIPLGVIADFSGQAYTYIIRRKFINPYNEFYDYCEAFIAGKNYIIITDGNRYPRMTDGTTFVRFDMEDEDGTRLDIVCKTLSFFGDRVWLGHILQNTTWYRDRYIWSRVLNKQVFDTIFFEDKPETTGTLVKILPLGKKQVVYYQDAMYIGTPSNIQNLPYLFQKVETGGIGIAGVRGVGSSPLGHFIVGQSNVYVLVEDGSFYPLESGVMETYLERCSAKNKICVVHDASNEMMVFGVPGTSQTDISTFLTYNWKLKAWSKFTFLAQTIEAMKLVVSITYDDIQNGVTYDSIPNGVTYQNYGQTSREQTLWFGVETALAYLSEAGTIDAGGANVPATFTTPVFDLELPDVNKTFSRLSIRLFEPALGDTAFTIYASIDEYSPITLEGLIRPIGTLTIRDGRLEGFITFRKTGSAVSFHAVQNVSGRPFHVREYVLTLSGRGLETSQSILYGSD